MLGKQLSYLTARQKVLAQNVSNANTPGYQAKDLVPLDFRSMMSSESTTPATPRPQMLRTDSAHLAPSGASRQFDARSDGRDAYEVAPDGNTVVLEEQIQKVAKTAGDYRLYTQLMRKHLDMLRLAVRRAQ
ncbi:MAG: flagellar basal body rod protein FlgB [Alphaproteobacteria bacterium]|nr:flagellar basal body rod protein FlgB [Alphaproteobacteria bacterium]